MARALDPQVEDLLDMFDAMNVPPTYALSVGTARDRLEELFETTDPEPVGEVSDLSIEGPAGDIPLRIYRPESQGPHPAVVYFHGGGWTVGSLDTHDGTARALTNAAECVIVSVDYRLAPENPFPAAVVDAYAATDWTATHGDALAVDTERIAVCGDSAGGNLSAAVSLMARDRDGPELAYQSLIYPAVNPPAIQWFDSYDENAEGYFLEYDSMDWFYDKYLAHETDSRNSYAFPLLARNLSELPPATVLTCEFDPLRDEGIAYAERLEAAGVETRLEHYEGMIHGFVSLKDHIDRGHDAIDTIAEDLRRVLH